MTIPLLCAAGACAAEPIFKDVTATVAPGFIELGQTIYWSVQAVDSAFAGGPFATENSVVSFPQLAINRTNPANAIVSWTPPTFGWVLQQIADLNLTNWIASPSGSANPANLPATNAAQFYRLSKS